MDSDVLQSWLSRQLAVGTCKSCFNFSEHISTVHGTEGHHNYFPKLPRGVSVIFMKALPSQPHASRKLLLKLQFPNHHFLQEALPQGHFPGRQQAPPPSCHNTGHFPCVNKYTPPTGVMRFLVDHLSSRSHPLEIIGPMRRGSVCGALATSSGPSTWKKSASKHLLNEKKSI